MFFCVTDKNSRELSIEILRFQLAQPSKGVAVDSLEAGRQVLNLPWSFDSRGPRLRRHLALLDSKRDVRVALGQMPRELTEGASLRIRPEVVLFARQCAEQIRGLLRLLVPHLDELLQFIRRHNAPPLTSRVT